MFLFTRAFWTYAGDRVAKSFGQALLAANVNEQLGLINVDSLLAVLGSAAVYALMSLATAMGAFPDVIRPPADEPEDDDLPADEREGLEGQTYFRTLPESTVEPGAHRVSTE